MDLGIEGKVALVMGASKGLGRAIAWHTLPRRARGSRSASRSPERLDEAAAEIGGETATFEADTADLESTRRASGTGCRRARRQRRDPGDEHGRAAAGWGAGRSTEDGRRAYRELVLAPRALIDAVLPACGRRVGGGS